jgi:hypothetical protein
MPPDGEWMFVPIWRGTTGDRVMDCDRLHRRAAVKRWDRRWATPPADSRPHAAR